MKYEAEIWCSEEIYDDDFDYDIKFFKINWQN